MFRHKLSLAVIGTLFAFLFLLVPAPLVVAQTQDYHVSDYKIDLELTTEGNYLITERITFNFVEGTFTKANRHVPGRGFDSVRFISIEGVNLPVESYNVSDGRNLRLDWNYPEATGEQTFVIQYEATKGLISQGDENVIDWNPIGEQWDVPIHNIDITITLPVAPGTIQGDPIENVTAVGNDFIRFFYPVLPPQTYYHVVVRFPEIIYMPPPPNALPYVLVALGIGAVLLFLQLSSRITNKPEAARSGRDPSELTIMQAANIMSPANVIEKRRGIAATIFSLAQSGYLKLRIKPARRLASAEVSVDVTRHRGDDAYTRLSETERIILDNLESKKTLKKFAQSTSTFNRIVKTSDEDMIKMHLISEEATKKRNTIAIIGIGWFLVGAAIIFVTGIRGSHPMWFVPGIVLVFQSITQFISSAIIEVRTPEGLYLKNEITRLLDEKLAKVDELIKYEVNEAWDVLFQELPYLVLHPKFTASKLNNYKRTFRRMDRVQMPEWMVVSEDGTVTDAVTATTSALTATEAVNYAFIMLMATARSSGATGVSGAAAGAAVGAGAAGVGAGGGGGGAG